MLGTSAKGVQRVSEEERETEMGILGLVQRQSNKSIVTVKCARQATWLLELAFIRLWALLIFEALPKNYSREKSINSVYNLTM